jgi:hypothetical protein
MLRRIKSSLAYRLPKLYRQILKLKRITVAGNKSKSTQVVLMMTGKYHLDMTRLAVLSIANSWDILPRLIIITDGTIAINNVIKKLSFWPGELSVQDWQETADYHSAKQRPALVNYANAHPFGKKMAIILHHANKQPVVWVDSDVLFFNDFTRYIPQNIKGFACGGSEDFMAAYHEAVLKKFDFQLPALYHFNAGILLAFGEGIYEDFTLENVLNAIHPDYDFCTEQTIFALIASKSLGIIWPLEVIKSFSSDTQQVKGMATKNVVARHYTSNVRHLFWRDAIFRV